MKRALCLAALCASVALYFSACAPPTAPRTAAKKQEAKAAPAAKTAQPKAAETPTQARPATPGQATQVAGKPVPPIPPMPPEKPPVPPLPPGTLAEAKPAPAEKAVPTPPTPPLPPAEAKAVPPKAPPAPPLPEVKPAVGPQEAAGTKAEPPKEVKAPEKAPTPARPPEVITKAAEKAPGPKAPEKAAVKTAEAPKGAKAPEKAAPKEARRPEKTARKPPEKRPEPKPVEKPEEAKPVAPPDLFIFSPQRRQRFVAGETAEVTLVIGTSGKLPGSAIELKMADEAGRSWTLTDRLEPLPKGRHSITYGIEVACFPPGAYKLSARLGNQSFGVRDLLVASAVPRTHFRIAGWLEKAPTSDIEPVRWSRILGLNTILLQDHAPWRSGGANTLDASSAEAFERVRTNPSAKPLELEALAPPFIETADLLTGAGLEWVHACAVSGGAQPPLQPERSLADPAVVRNAHQRIHHRLLAERVFRQCVGIHLTTESSLGWARTPDYEGPFGVPAQMEGFKKLPGSKGFSWRDGAKNWDPWRGFMLYRAGILGGCLADWTGAVRAVEPGALVASQLHGPLNLAEGTYLPLAAKGLPIISTQVGLNGPAGLLMSPVVADLARAGHWEKPLWLMPEVSDDADLDEFRAGILLALGRKLDGVVYPSNLDYPLSRPAAGPLATNLMAGIGGLNEWLARYGDFLLALDRPREVVAILYSVTEHIARIGQDPVKLSQASSYPWTLVAAYAACQGAHFPATFLTEAELLADAAAKTQAILVIGLTRVEPDVRSKLEAYAAKGGVVLTDPTTKVALKGAKPFDREFPDLGKYHDELWRKGEQEKVDTTLERRDVVVWTKLIAPLLRPLRDALKDRHVERDFTVSDPDMLTSEQRYGAARYIFVANNTQRGDIFRGLKWELAPGQTKVTLREGEEAIYKATEAKLFEAPRVKGNRMVPVMAPAGGVSLLALLSAPITHVRISRARHSGNQLALAAQVRAEGLLRPYSLDAAVPLEIILRDPAGRERLRLYRAHTRHGYSESIPLAAHEQPGRWSVVVRELFSRKEAKDSFTVRASSPAWASRCGPLAAFDGGRVAGLLRSAKPLWIIVGTDAEAKRAEPLAKLLRSEKRAVEVKLAAALAKPRELDSKAAASYLSAAPKDAPMPDVRPAAILLGHMATHALLRAVHNAGILPRAVTPDYPGPGGAVLCWLLSAFEPDAEVVVAAAADEAGVGRAIEALEAAARGRAPATAWSRLTGSPTVAEAEPKAERKVLLLAAAWEKKILDEPTAVSMPLAGDYYVAGSYDGFVRAYDSIGQESWAPQFPTRVRALATDPDGLFTLVGSYPLVVLLNPRGRPQWVLPFEDPSPRADITAVAVGAQGILSIAGTRSGKVLGIGQDGKPVFALGGAEIKEPGKEAQEPPEGRKAPEPKAEKKGKDSKDPKKGKDEKKAKEGPEPKAPIEPKEGRDEVPSSFGAIGAVAISPKCDFAVIGGELATAAVDKAGQPLWSSKELGAVASIAIGLGDNPCVAIGSRAGFVACLGKDGAVLWRRPSKSYVASVCFVGATQKVVAASLDGSLTCYDEAGKELWSRRSPAGFRFVASSRDGEVIAAAEWAGKVILLNASGELLTETEPIAGVLRAMALSGDGRFLLVGAAPNSVTLFRYERTKTEEDEL